MHMSWDCEIIIFFNPLMPLFHGFEAQCGGLDPADVFQSLPEIMQKGFESQDIGLLQEVIKELPEEDARCS